MKALFNNIGFICIVGALFFTSCNNDNGNTDATSNKDSGNRMTTDSNSISSNTNIPKDNTNQEVINNLVQKNTKELIWLQAAIDNKNSAKEIKKHASMMVKDHKKLEEEVKELTSKKSWNIPSVDTANIININDKSGNEWDKAWANKMVSEHTELLNMLTNAQKNVSDTELKELITKTISVVQSHLRMANELNSKIK